jgi:hypothetical protein
MPDAGFVSMMDGRKNLFAEFGMAEGVAGSIAGARGYEIGRIVGQGRRLVIESVGHIRRVISASFSSRLAGKALRLIEAFATSPAVGPTAATGSFL